MPVYVYKNLTTGETFEVQQRITEPALTEHPESGDPVKRLVQPVGIAFKGSGFYVTDSRQTGNGAAGRSKASGNDGSGGGAEGSSGDGSSGDGSGGGKKDAPAEKAKPKESGGSGSSGGSSD